MSATAQLDYLLERIDQVESQKRRAVDRQDEDVDLYLAGYRSALLDVLRNIEDQS